MVKKADTKVVSTKSARSKKATTKVVSKKVIKPGEGKAVSRGKGDSSKPVEIKVNKLTEQGLEQVFDKIIERNTKNKPPVKVKYRPPKKPKAALDAAVSASVAVIDRKAAERNKKAIELRKAANKLAAQLRQEADERAAWIKQEAEEKAAWVKQDAEAKVHKLHFKSNRKAVKRELKEAIRQAKIEAAEKLGKTAKKPAPKAKFNYKTIRPESMKTGGLGAKKSIRNVFVASVISSLLIVGAGIAYTWYMGLSADTASGTAPVAAVTQQDEYKPAVQAANAKEGAAVQSISSPILPGSPASISVRTNPNSVCTISVKYNDVASRDPGLVTKTADKYGMVNWDWVVGQGTPVGKWPVTVTCTLNNKSAVVIGDLMVVNAANQ